MNKRIKKIQKEQAEKKFDLLDGIFVLSYGCPLFKSECLTNINCEENRKPNGENWYADTLNFQNSSIIAMPDDKLLYLKPLVHKFEIVGSINLRFTALTMLPLNSTFKDFWLIEEAEQHRILRNKCLAGHELLHMRTNTKVWVSETMISYIC